MNIERANYRFNHIRINGVNVSQNINIIGALEQLKNYINEQDIIISDIIEIGTLHGGFTSILAELFQTTIHTFDIEDKRLPKNVFEKYSNVKYYLEDAFGSDIIKHLITNAKQNCLVFCDGGDKIKEFNTFAEFLKPNDFIFCHDYIKTYKIFKEEYKDKIWNWQESHYEAIKPAVEQFKLENILAEHFEPAVWASYKKPNE